MKSDLPKVLHRLAGRTLIEHVLRTAGELHPASTVLVVGHGSDEYAPRLRPEPTCPDSSIQSPQLGTGHALLQAEQALQGRRERCCCSMPTFRCSSPVPFCVCSKRTETRARLRPC